STSRRTAASRGSASARTCRRSTRFASPERGSCSMAHVTFTPHLQRFFPTLAACDIDGPTVRTVIEELERRYPGFASYIVDEAGRRRPHVNIFVGEEPIRDRESLGDALGASTPVF